MSKKLKVVTIVGTRPEIIKLSRVMAKLDQSDAIEHIHIHTGQNFDYNLNTIFYDKMNIKYPDVYLGVASNSDCETISKVIEYSGNQLKEIKPDAALILGDTNSGLSAIAAKKLQIPIFHMEAGNRCFDQRVPEEINRKIIDHISDINLPYSDISLDMLIREGLPPDRIIKTGSPMYEVIKYYRPSINKSKILKKLGLENGKYFVVSFHRAENVDCGDRLFLFFKILNVIADKYKMPIIFSVHPRTKKKIDALISKIKIHKWLRTPAPFGFFDYIELQSGAFAVLSDSGTISEEASILGFNALNLRDTHERHEAMENANVIMTGLNQERILQGLEQLQYNFTIKPVNDYEVPNVSDKIVRIILSYTDYVNRTVYGKQR
jgi:UDP-N-acetylglucosamine 2-epimerase (non-hydrolysing)